LEIQSTLNVGKVFSVFCFIQVKALNSILTVNIVILVTMGKLLSLKNLNHLVDRVGQLMQWSN